MLKGHTFNLQTFTSEAFALFIDKFLNGRCGVAKGCNLSNTNTSVTITDGYFVVRGRFLQIVSGETVSDIIDNGFYSLVCEIDLSKINTADTLNQAEIKVLRDISNYPNLSQQDITGNGTVYQYEFARFKVESGNITNFTDKRTFVDFTTIYDAIENESEELIEDIREALSNVLDGSSYILKTRSITETGENLDDYTEEGRYFFASEYTPINIPEGVNGWLEVLKESTNWIKQTWYRAGTKNANDYMTWVRTKINGSWSEWKRYLVDIDILNLIYPIGSIYLSVRNTNPSVLFGGTWVAWGAGRAPIGVNTNDSDFNTVEKTGGEKTHKLTVNEMPSHRHISSSYKEGNAAAGDWASTPMGHTNPGKTGDYYSDYTGGGQPHNNLQPYITCYMWKRTA